VFAHAYRRQNSDGCITFFALSEFLSSVSSQVQDRPSLQEANQALHQVIPKQRLCSFFSRTVCGSSGSEMVHQYLHEDPWPPGVRQPCREKGMRNPECKGGGDQNFEIQCPRQERARGRGERERGDQGERSAKEPGGIEGKRHGGHRKESEGCGINEMCLNRLTASSKTRVSPSFAPRVG
jgi:hypothetical protein